MDTTVENEENENQYDKVTLLHVSSPLVTLAVKAFSVLFYAHGSSSARRKVATYQHCTKRYFVKLEDSLNSAG